MYVGIVLIFCGLSVSGFNFNVKQVIEIKLKENETVDGSYFGYSLLLQRGDIPMVIVGTPKHNNVTGGAVFACNITDNKECNKYDIYVVSEPNSTFSGNFLGSVIDGGENVGDPFLVCAPKGGKASRDNDGLVIDHWTEGACAYQKSSLDIKSIAIESLYRYAASEEYGENQIDDNNRQFGFDARLFKDTDGNENSYSAFIGAVGFNTSRGSVVFQSLEESYPFEVWSPEIILETYDYLGYKVERGVFGEENYAIVGAPRGHDLFGMVVVFYNETSYETIQGEEFASYFGSALLASDVDGDHSDDLFVGAPMASGELFDEGCVYYYRNISVKIGVKLTGGKKKGARFGTNIVSLGDIDLDSYNDVAISAPFEDDGIGAVYIYRGGIDGVVTEYSQRLSPSSFSITYASAPRGFGLGLSRGVDIDGNGLINLAIGAYQSGDVFVLHTQPIIEVETFLESNASLITFKRKEISVTFCVNFQYRSNRSESLPVEFQFQLTLDSRVVGTELYVANVTGFPNTNECRSVNFTVQDTWVDISPFNISLLTTVLGDVYGQIKSTNPSERSIPYDHGCGSDNICQTNITLKAKSDVNTIFLGEKSNITVDVFAKNDGEPGYNCQLFISGPKISEILLKECIFENSSYVCPFLNKLSNHTLEEIQINFSVETYDINLKNIQLDFQVKCLGENLNQVNESVNVEVIIQNSPTLEGRSLPERLIIYDNIANDEKITISHIFTVGNLGPSPFKADFLIAIPSVKIGNENLFEFIKVTDLVHGNETNCFIVDQQGNIESPNVTQLVATPLNLTETVDCSSKENCIRRYCQGNLLFKSSRSMNFNVMLQTKSSLIVHFLNQTESKKYLALITSASISNATIISSVQVPTLIELSHKSEIPLWIFLIVIIVIIIVIAGLIIFLLIKCKFFERKYRIKMKYEKVQIHNTYEIDAFD